MPSPHPTIRRLGITLAIIIAFILVFILLIVPFLYNAWLYYGNYAVGTAIVTGDMVGAKRSLQMLYRYRGCIYVLGALVYGGMLGYDAVEGVAEGSEWSGERGHKKRVPWTMTQTVETCVCGVLLGYGIILMWYGWMD